MIVGIDLGTTNSLIALWKDDASVLVPNALGELLTPSVVGLDDEGRILVGQAARERLHTHPSLTTALFKRHMASAHQTALGDHLFRPEELSALVLRSLKEDVERAYGETVVEAVISVPAYFSDAQRKATRIAGELAGLKVEKLINEPTAAALAFGLPQHGKESSFLVFDLGGGTFDVSILELFEGVMEVRASAGDNFLGGEDFDRLLAEAFVRSQAEQPGFPTPESITHALHREAQRLRIALGQARSGEFVLRVDGKEWQQTFTQEDIATLYAPCSSGCAIRSSAPCAMPGCRSAIWTKSCWSAAPRVCRWCANWRRACSGAFLRSSSTRMKPWPTARRYRRRLNPGTRPWKKWC